MLGRRGERGSGISVLAARHDDDDDIYIYIYSFSIYFKYSGYFRKKLILFPILIA